VSLKLRRCLPVVAVAVAIAAADLLGALQPLDNWLTAERMRTASRPPTGDIVVIDIDTKSLTAIGTWPWPRTVHADLIDRLRALKAGEIALDIDFSAASTPAGDTALEEALERAGGSVILAAFKQKETAKGGKDALAYNRPIQRFADHAWIASFSVEPDNDGVVRRMVFGDTVDNVFVPSLPTMFSGQAGIAGNQFLVDFGVKARDIDRIPAIDVLDGTVQPGRVAGKKVIVGAAAVELRDYFQVPVYGTVSGALLEAVAADGLSQGRSMAQTGVTLMLLGLALITGLVAAGFGRVRWMLLVAALAVAAVAIEAAAAAVQTTWPIVVATGPWQAALVAFAVLVLIREIDVRRISLLMSWRRVRNTQTMLDRIVADNFAGVLVVDEDFRIHAASRAASAILGVSGDLVGSRSTEILPPVMAAAVAAAIARLRSDIWQETGLRETECRCGDGETRIIEYVVTPSRMEGRITEDGRRLADSLVACLTFSDVTERRRAEARLAYLARFDTLTGLANRNQFVERVEAAPPGECAVMLVGLDRFDRVNRTLGHAVGDGLLCAVAERVSELVTASDVLARVDGDKFAVLLCGSGATERANALADKLIARVGEPYAIDKNRMIASLSFGVVASGESRDADSLIKAAEIALDRAKARGGSDCVVFEAEMIAGQSARQMFELEMWEAFEQNEFEVLYQPQIDLHSGHIVGVEALLRWDHPERGSISPAEFIPVAETTGLIEPLGEWVLERATADVASWPAEIKLAVNVSAIQFVRGNLVTAVKRALAKSGLPARQLDLEITESLIMEEYAQAEAAMSEIRELGVGFALDDFGTGYSSLSYLQKFPIDKVKLDRSFIAGLPFDQESVAIVRAVSALAQSLGLRLNAEGIEQPEQVTFLRLLGCNEGQGYLYGVPMPASEMVEKLEARSQRRSA